MSVKFMDKLHELLEIMKEHQKLDRLVQGVWLINEEVEGAYRGCFFGCAMQTPNNAIGKACAKYGLPLWIGHWSEFVFEGLKSEDAVKWPVQLLEALINFKGDTEKLRHDLAIKRLTDLLPTENQVVNSAIELVINDHKNPDEEGQRSAKSAAAADAAADSDAAAWSAALAARSAADVADADAYAAAMSAAWSRERDWMLELLREEL